MADFDRNLQPIIKSTGYQLTDIKLNPAKDPGMAFASPGGGGVSDLSREEDVFSKLKAAATPSAPKGIFVSNADLEANKRYKFFNPTIGDYEDFAAQGQEWYKQATNGVLKGANLAATTIAGGFGTLYGVGKAVLPGGKFSDIFQNEVMTNLDKWNNYVDNELLPNYYTAAERNAEWYSTDNWFTTNFLFDKLIKNSGYAVGAMVGGNIANATLLSVGAKLGGLAAKGAAAAEASQAFKLFTPLLRNTSRAFSAGKNVEAAALLESKISSIADLSTRTSQLANIAKQTGQFAKFSDAARRTAVATYSSAGEASFEALQTSKEYRENLIEEFRKEKGFDPTGEELSKIDREAAQVGKTSFLGNMALLAITEYAQLPYLMGSTYSSSRQAANSLLGEVDEVVLDATGKYVSKNAPKTKFGKLYQGSKRIGAYVFDPKESAQEISQYTLQVGTQNYFKKGRENGEADLFVDGFLYGLIGEDEYGEGVGALVSKEGIEGGILGGITGGGMQAFTNVGRNKALAKNTESFLSMLNGAPTFKDAFKQRLDAANRGVVLQEQHRDAILNGDKLEATDLKNDQIFNYLSPRIKYGRFDMVMEDLAELKQAGMTEQGLSELKQQGMANINDTVDSFQKRITSIENSSKALNDVYQSLNIRYAGETMEIEGKTIRKYSPEVIDMLAYAGTKIANYDMRIPDLNGKLASSGINTQAILQDIIQTGVPNAEATKEALQTINSMNVTSDVKDELKGTLDDVIELSLRRRMFINEYDGIKNNPLNYERPEEEVDDVDVRQKEGRKKVTKTLEVGKTYSLEEPIRLENGKLVLAPKLTVLSSTLGGEFEVKLPDGTATYFSPEQFDQYKITEEDNTSQELENTLNQSIDDVLNYPAFRDVVEKPAEGVNKLEYINALGDQKLIKAVLNRFKKLSKDYFDKVAERKKVADEIKNQKDDIDKQQDDFANGPTDPKVDFIDFNTYIGSGETGPLKTAADFFRATNTESEEYNDPTKSAPHVTRSREFLNNARKFKNRDKLRAIVFTKNQEDALGLSGIAQLLYGAKWDQYKDKVNDVDSGFVGAVFIEVDGKQRYFVDKNGNRLSPVGQQVDLGKVVFQTMPTTEIVDSKGKDRFRSNTPGEKEQFLTNRNQWVEDRKILFNLSADNLPTSAFRISKGFPKVTGKDSNNEYVKNKVGETLISEEDIINSTGILKISTGTPIPHNGENMNAKPGLVYFQDADTLQVLNNNRLGAKKAKTVFEVIKSLISEMEAQALAGKKVQLDRQKLAYLRSILIYSKSVDDIKSNQLWVDIDSLSVKIGNKSYPFSDFAKSEKEMIDVLSNLYHSANKKVLDENKEYLEFVIEDGNLTTRTWDNYQEYLISGVDRNVDEIPFVTNLIKPTEAVPYNYAGKYAVLENLSIGEKVSNFESVEDKDKEDKEVDPPTSGPSASDVNELTPIKIGNIEFNSDKPIVFKIKGFEFEYEMEYTNGKITKAKVLASDKNNESLTALMEVLDKENSYATLADKLKIDPNSSKENIANALIFKQGVILANMEIINAQKQASPTAPEAPVSDKKAEKADVKKDRYYNSPVNRMVKVQKESENRNLTQEEIDKIEQVIEKAKELGWDRDRLFRQLTSMGYSYALGNNPEGFKNYLEDRLSGKTNIKVTSEYNFFKQLDAELAALEEANKAELPIQYQYNIPSRQDIKGKLKVSSEEKMKVESIIDAFRIVILDVNAESIYEGFISEALSEPTKKLLNEYFKGGYNNWAGKSQEHINKHNELSRRISKSLLDDYISFLKKYGWKKGLEKYTGEIPKELTTPQAPVSDVEAKKADIERRRQEAIEGIQTMEELGLEAPVGKEGFFYADAFGVDPEESDLDSFEGKTKQEVIDKINAKYDTELAALEETKPAETKTPPTKEKTTEESTKPKKGRFKSGYKDTRQEAAGEVSAEKTSDQDIAIFREWAKKNVPNIPYEILERMITLNDGRRAWGVFENGVAKFFKKGLRGTEYHEVFEGIWKGFLSEEERQALLNEFKNKPGFFVDRESGQQVLFTEATDRQAKERIADDFADFRLGKLPARSLSERIRRFFKAIVDFFRSFVQKPSLKDDLFNAIESGRFREYTLPETVVTEQPEYRMQMILPDGDVLSEDEAWELVQDMTLSISSYLFNRGNDDTVANVFDRKKVTGTDAYNFIREVYAENGNLDGLGEKVFNDLYLRTVDYLKTIGVNIDAESIVSVNDENGNNRLYSPEAFEVDFKKNMKFAIKYLISTQPAAEQVYDVEKGAEPKLLEGKHTGLHMLMNFNKTFATLLSNLSGVPISKVPSKLKELVNKDGNYYRIARAIRMNMENGTFDLSQFTTNDITLYIQFLQAFNKSKPDVVVEQRTVTEDGVEVYTKPADRASAINVEKYTWLSNVRALSNDPDSLIVRRKNIYYINTKSSKFPKTTPNTNKDRLAFLKSIGIMIPSSSIVNIDKYLKNQFVDAVNRIYTYGTEKGFASVDKFLGADGAVAKLAEVQVIAMNPDQDTTRLNVENKRSGTYTDSNAVSVFEEDFNDASSIEELLAKRPELNDVFAKNSLILKKGGLFFNKLGKKIEGRVLKVGAIEGVSEDGEGTMVANLTEGKRFTVEINQNINGNYYILVPADSSTERTLNLGNYIKFEDIGTEAGNKKLFELFKNYLNDEIDLALDWRNRIDLAATKPNAKQLRFFKDILSPELVSEIEGIIATEDNIDEAKEQINKILDSKKSEVNQSILDTIDYLNNSLNTKLINLGEVNFSGEEEYSYYNLDSDFAKKNGIDKSQISKDDYNRLLTFVNINQAIANIEMHKFVFGDPYQFEIKNGNLDETKRIKSWLSPRRKSIDSKELNDRLNKIYDSAGDVKLASSDKTRHNFKSFLNTVTLSDPTPFSRYISTFGNYKEADGFSMISIGAYKEAKIKTGDRWSNEAEDWYQWQMAYARQRLSTRKDKYKYTYKNKALEKHDAELIQKPSPVFVTEVLKPIVSGAKPELNRIEAVIDKYSQMPIYMKAVEGTHLEDFYAKMIYEDIDYAVYKSGRKEGTRSTYNMYSAGKMNTQAFDEKSIEKIAWSTYGIQVENSYEEKDQTRGSQLMKNASMDMFENGKSVMKGAEELYKESLDINNQFHQQAYNEFLNKLGIQDLGTSYVIKDAKKVSETLEYELLRRDASMNVIDAIRLDENGQFRIPFEASSNYEEIRSVLFSLVNKSLLSPAMSGKPHVQVPVTGWESKEAGRKLLREVSKGKFVEISTKEYEALADKDKKSVVLASDTLKFYNNKDGERYMEVMIPNYWKKYFPDMTDEQVLEYLNRPENQKILFGVGFRIPHQAMSSTEVFKIKSFLDPGMGSTVVVPSEIVEKAGSDFDIDKLNMYLKSVYLDENRNVKLIEYKGSKQATLDFYEDFYERTIGKQFEEVYRKQDIRKKLIEVFKRLDRIPEDVEYTTSVIRKALGKDLMGYYLANESMIDDIQDQAYDENLNPITYLEKQIERFDEVIKERKNKYAQRMYRKSLENQYFDVLQRMVSLPDNFDRLMSKISDAGLPNVAKELDAVRNESEASIKNKLISKSFLTSLRHAFVLGKKWVGIAAVNITGHSIAQKINAHIDPAKLSQIDDYDTGFLGDLSLSVPHNKTIVNGKEVISLGGRTTAYTKKDKDDNDIVEFISDRLSGYATSFVDVAKDPYIMKIIQSDLIVGTALFMERIGVGELTAYFINQPIITQYLKHLDKIGSRSIFSQTNIDEIASEFPVKADTPAYNLKNDFPVDANGVVDFNKSKASLLSSIDINAERTNEFNAKQQAVLREFLRLAKMAQYSFKFTQAYNYDTTRARTTEGVLRKALRTETAQDTNIISSVNDVFNQTFIGKQKDLLIKEVKSLSSVFKLDADKFYSVIDDVIRPFALNEYMSMDDFDRIVKKIKTSFIDYLVQTKSNLLQENKVKSLLTGKNNIAERLLAMRKKHPSLEILQVFEPRFSKQEDGPATISLKVKPSDAPTTNRYIEMMRELKALESEFYNDLILVNLLQGSYDTRVSITKIVPLEDRASIITPVINNNYAIADIENFAKDAMFARTNFNDDQIVPMFDPKIEAVEGRGDYSKSGFVTMLELGVKIGNGRVMKLSKKYERFNNSNMDLIKTKRYKYIGDGQIKDITTPEADGGLIDLDTYKNAVLEGKINPYELIGYKRVKDDAGNPLEDDKGNIYFKMVNLYGERDIVKEYRTDGKPSIFYNGAYKLDQEISDAQIVSYVNGKIVEEAKPSPVSPVAPVTEVVTPTATTTGKVERSTRMINRSELRKNPRTLYLFGDNDVRKGLGGQAKEMRNEPNAIGISTKKLPATSEQSYKTDVELDQNKKIITDDINKVIATWDSGKYDKLVIPEMGTGLAELPTRAPQTFAFLQQELKRLENYINGTSQQVVTPVAPVTPVQQPTQVVSQTVTPSKSLTTLSLQPDNVEKVKNGTKNITNRKDELREGMYKLPDGTVVNLTSLGRFKVIPGKEGVSILNKSGVVIGSMPKDEFAQREGFKDWADFTANNKYSSGFINDGQIRNVYSIELVTPSTTETIAPVEQPTTEVVEEQLSATNIAKSTRIGEYTVYEYGDGTFDIEHPTDGIISDNRQSMEDVMKAIEVDRASRQQEPTAKPKFTYKGKTIETDFELSDSQRKALERLIDFSTDPKAEFITLQGPAGTGKTSVIGYLDKYLGSGHRLNYFAPTHAATAELAFATVKTGNRKLPMTIASAIIGKTDRQTGEKSVSLTRKAMERLGLRNNVFVIDEVSMLNSEDYENVKKLVKTAKIKVIFMGDVLQIPEVNELNPEKKLVSKAFTEHEQVALTEVKRTRSESIKNMLVNIRENINNKIPIVESSGELEYLQIGDFNAKIAETFEKEPEETVLISYTNKGVQEYNQKIRSVLGRVGNLTEGDIITGYLGYASKQIDKQKIANSVRYTVKSVKKNGSMYSMIVSSSKLKKLEELGVAGAEELAYGSYAQLSRSDSFDFSDLTDEDFAKNNAQLSFKMEELYQAKLRALQTNKGYDWVNYQEIKDRLAEYLSDVNLGDDYIYNFKTKQMEKFNFKQHEFLVKGGFKSDLFINKGIDFGHAITIHKSQGSTVKNVFFDATSLPSSNVSKLMMNGKEISTEKHSLLYVGVSRASEYMAINSSTASNFYYPEKQAVVAGEFASLFTKERQEEILTNFAKKHSMSKQEALSYINNALVKNREDVIAKLNECY